MPILLTRQKRKEKHQQQGLLAALPRNSALCSQGHSEPLISSSGGLGHHSHSRGFDHPSAHRRRGLPDSLCLSSMIRRHGYSRRGHVPVCLHATTVGKWVTLHVTVRCHPSKASNQVKKIRRTEWLISSLGRCTTQHLRVFPREL